MKHGICSICKKRDECLGHCVHIPVEKRTKGGKKRRKKMTKTKGGAD